MHVDLTFTLSYVTYISHVEVCTMSFRGTKRGSMKCLGEHEIAREPLLLAAFQFCSREKKKKLS